MMNRSGDLTIGLVSRDRGLTGPMVMEQVVLYLRRVMMDLTLTEIEYHSADT